jgi:putative N6-adenine-specific DNA methylase
MAQQFELIAKTFMGLEPVLAKELAQLGASDVQVGRRMVSFMGDKELMYRANFQLHTAIRILKPIKHFKALSADDVYDGVKDIDWSEYIGLEKTFAVDSVVFSEEFRHSKFVAYKVKDAIVDQFRERTGKRPNISISNPDIRLHIHIAEDKCTLCLDSSGESLHRRGYRQESVEAPLNEVLAAGMIKLAGWKCDTNFYDPMCGSGTLVIEAAMMANNIPAQYYRGGKFAFKRWKEFNLGEWKSVKEQEDRKIGSGDFECEIWGNDIDMQVLQQAEKNLEYTKLHKDVMLFCGSFEDQDPPEGKTLIVTNPPYGERIKIEDLNAMYEQLGDTFKKKYGENCEVWLITSDFEAMKHIGLKPSKKIPLLNGQLDCRFLKFELYEGSKKAKKQEAEESDE